MCHAGVSDEEMVRRFREGDEHAFRELYRRFRPACFDLEGGPRPPWLRKVPPALIWSHVTEFEDLFQRVLEDTAKRTYRSGGPARYRTYLKRALTNKVASWFRVRDRGPWAVALDNQPAHEGTAPDPAWLAERLEHVDSMYDCIDELSEKERHIIEQRLTGQTLAQIGRDLGIREETCRKRHQRAKEHLRNCLARKGFTNQE